MDINFLLEYQNLDLQRIKVESEFVSGSVCKTYNACVNNLNNAMKSIERLNNDAEEMMHAMNSLIEQYNVLAQDLTESENSMTEIKDTKEVDFFVRKAEQLSGKISQLSREIGAMSQKIAEVRTQYEKAVNQSNDAKKKGKEIEGTYKHDLMEARKKSDELKTQMKELESKIDQKFIDFYKRMRQSSKGAVIVALSGTNCGGCFMDIPGGLLQKLEDSGIIDCPHCGRLIYKKQNG